LARILAVAFLGAETLGIDHQHAIGGHAAVATRQQAFAHRLGQRGRVGDVEAQLDRGRDLVDVLPARSAGADEPFDELVLRDRDAHAGGPCLACPLECGLPADKDAAMAHRIFIAALLLISIWALPAQAQEAQSPADDARIDRLLEVTRAREMLDATLPQIEASQQQMLAQMTAGRELDAAQRQRIDALLASSSSAVRKALSWENLAPVYRDIYRQTFTGEDIDAIIAFYESPAGQRMLEKMPALMQNTMTAMQRLIVPMLQQMERELAAEVSAAE